MLYYPLFKNSMNIVLRTISLKLFARKKIYSISPLLMPPLEQTKKGLNWRMAVIEGVDLTEFKKEKGTSGILCVAVIEGRNRGILL